MPRPRVGTREGHEHLAVLLAETIASPARNREDGCTHRLSMTDGLDISSESDGSEGLHEQLELAADFVAELLDNSDSDDTDTAVARGGSADAAARCSRSHKYRDTLRKFQFEGLPGGLQLEQRYLAVAETGGAVYDAGVVLSRWLCLYPTAVRSLPVLELGCGPGLTALTAAALGASEVIATDMDESALGLARDNIDASLKWLSQCPSCVCSPELLRYRWGDVLPATLQSWQHRATDRGGIILAADVLYDNDESFAALLSTLSLLLVQSPAGDGLKPSSVQGGPRNKQPFGSFTCLVCFPRRRADTEQSYVDTLQSMFSVECLDIPSSVSIDCDREMVLLCVQPRR